MCRIALKRKAVFYYFVQYCLKISLPSFCFLKNTQPLNKCSNFSRKKQNLLLTTTLLQLEALLIPTYFVLEPKIIMIIIYKTLVFVATLLLQISVLKVNESLQILKSTDKVNSKGSGQS